MEFVKFVALFIAVLYTCSNAYRIMHKNNISAFNMLMQAGGITVFVWLQWIAR